MEINSKNVSVHLKCPRCSKIITLSVAEAVNLGIIICPDCKDKMELLRNCSI